jgi:hypothetical protein
MKKTVSIRQSAAFALKGALFLGAYCGSDHTTIRSKINSGSEEGFSAFFADGTEIKVYSEEAGA